MKKWWIILTVLIILIIVIIGFVYYEMNSPFQLNGVNIPNNINTLTKTSQETIDGYLVVKGGENIIKNCYVVSYNPDSSLNNIQICKPKISPESAINNLINIQLDFNDKSGIKYSKEDIKINGVTVRTFTYDPSNCGNPGYCTHYYWKQGSIIFNTETRSIAENYIDSNKGLF